jgi:hypothetical protein
MQRSVQTEQGDKDRISSRWPDGVASRKAGQARQASSWVELSTEANATFGVVAAEIEKTQDEIDALLRECIGEEAYQEYLRECADTDWAADEEEERYMRGLVGDDLYEKHFRK